MNNGKNIFQVWFQGCDKIEKNEFKENVKNWKILNPGWNYHCLNDSDLRKFCYAYSNKCGLAYDKAQFMHAKIDLGKVVSIYLYGGIMIDMDMFILRSLDTFPPVKEFFKNSDKEDTLAVSKLNLNFIEHLVFSGNTESYNNAVILSTKNNKLLKIWIDKMVDAILSINEKYTNGGLYVHYTTGPKRFNTIFTSENLKLSKLITFDYTIFEPCETMGTSCNVTNDTLSLHKFELSWIPEQYKSITYIYFNYIRKYFPIILLSGGLIYIFRKQIFKNKIKT